MLLDLAGSVQHVDPVGEMGAGFHRSRTMRRRRWSLSRSNALAAAASAALSFGASTVPRNWPCFLMSETRQLRSLAAAGLCLVGFFAAFMDRIDRGLDGLSHARPGGGSPRTDQG